MRYAPTAPTALAALIALLAGCELYDSPAEALDAGSACEPTSDRNVSCRHVCRVEMEMCVGASSWEQCFAECRTGFAAGAWCPGQRCACDPSWPTCPPGCEPPM